MPPALPHAPLCRLLREISTAMAAQLKPGRFRRVLRLRKDESRLARFTSRLDAASEAFKVRPNYHISPCV
jgi:hypothetical protein